MKHYKNQHHRQQHSHESVRAGETVSVVHVVKERGLGVQERIRRIPKVLHNNQWTITRRHYFANTKARTSPSAKELPPPPSTWLVSGSTEDVTSSNYDSDESSNGPWLPRNYTENLCQQIEEICQYSVEKSANWSGEKGRRRRSVSSSTGSSTASDMEEAMSQLARSFNSLPAAMDLLPTFEPLEPSFNESWSRNRSQSANM